MPAERIAMRQVRDVLRLNAAGVSGNEIARRVGVAPSTVRLTLKRLAAAGFGWPLPAEMTDAEKLLWSKIRGKQLKGFQVYRQKPIGRFVVDFYCPKAKLVIELDGGQHYSEVIRAKDESRDRYMERVGLEVLRFSDTEVFENLPGVLEEIWNRL